MRARLLTAALAAAALAPAAADWPQWRGPNRDAHADFKAPAAWPKELTKGWSVPVGDGVATPALAGDRLYAFTWQDGNELTRCLDAATGKEVWKDSYPAKPAAGPASGFPGARSSPAVAGGKVVTLGVQGTLSCLDAATGKVAWRKDDTGRVPGFFASSSPLIAGGVVVAQVGGDRGGAVAAFDLATGNEKWRWAADGTTYASPALVTVDGVEAVAVETAGTVAVVGLAGGNLLWQAPFNTRYNASSPVVVGTTLIYGGSAQPVRAVKLAKEGDKLAATELWTNRDFSVIYDTPVVAGGRVYGISERTELFCLDAATGKTVWSAPLGTMPKDGNPMPKGGGGGGRKGGGGGGGYGSVVAAGPVLFALTPAGQLVVFEPGKDDFKEVARYKVADRGTYAYPVVAGNRVFVKDQDAVTLWTVP